jgi:hypothetical protein
MKIVIKVKVVVLEISVIRDRFIKYAIVQNLVNGFRIIGDPKGID